MKPVQRQQNHDYFIYDQDLLEQVGGHDFDVRHYQANNSLRGQAQGRGTTHFIRMTGGLDCVLRHYRRGGWIANLTEDQYFWTGLEKTRAWREWHLLKDMLSMHLPVPYPVAAQVRRGKFFYRADIITRQIPSARSLSTLLTDVELTDEQWQSLGNIIREFHQRGIYHADLNAHNILIDESEKFYLIDFDKGEHRTPSDSWQRANIDRLLRSLQKLKQQNQKGFYFSLHHWDALLQAYASDSRQ